jgi:hypothetical protein
VKVSVVVVQGKKVARLAFSADISLTPHEREYTALTG